MSDEFDPGNGWISAETSPTEEGPYLCWTYNGVIISNSDGNGRWHDDDCSPFGFSAPVEYWQPLPNPPAKRD